MIENVGTASLDRFKAEARQLLEGTINNQQEQSIGVEKQVDRVSLGNHPVDDVTYSAPVSDLDLGTTFTMLRDLFATNLKEQGVAALVAAGDGEINLESLTPEEATELVSDDGYFGVENTAKRIFDFAVGLAGDDTTRLDVIVKGVSDGYSKAEKAWGGTLPDISYDTRDALATMLEEWSGQDVEL